MDDNSIVTCRGVGRIIDVMGLLQARIRPRATALLGHRAQVTLLNNSVINAQVFGRSAMCGLVDSLEESVAYSIVWSKANGPVLQAAQCNGEHISLDEVLQEAALALGDRKRRMTTR